MNINLIFSPAPKEHLRYRSGNPALTSPPRTKADPMPLTTPMKPQSRARLILASAALAAAMLVLAGCDKKEAGNEIVIGEYGSLTGATATFGQSSKKGIEMAVDAINQSGGVLGKKLKVLIEDDQGKPE